MNRRRCLLIAAAAFLGGVLAGGFIQSRRPVEGWTQTARHAVTPAATEVATIARLPAARRLVLLLAGQSNAANYGSVPADGGPGVFAWRDGTLVRARDPLPGADGSGGSPWTRLGARLMLTGDFDAVVLASLAVGGSRAADWAPGGRLHQRLMECLQTMRQAGLPPDFILWQQGEEESGDPSVKGTAYLASLESLVASTREVLPNARWVVARAAYIGDQAANAQIADAQRLAAALPGASPGPDLDALGAGFRRDGVHFNGPGLEAAAALWEESLWPLLAASKRSE